jgi:ComF family protein
MLASISNFLLALREFIFPNICFFCKKNLDRNQLRICPECWTELTPITNNDQTYLHKKSELRDGDIIDDFLACFLFQKDKRIQDVLHGLKYEQKTSFGTMLGKHLGKKMLTENIFTSADYLIPIPLHSLKLRERGYNQSECIAAGITSVTKIPMRTNILYRTRYTQSQTHLNFAERQENVKDVFMIKKNSGKHIEGKTIILVDDVMTTGATTLSAAGILKKNGVQKILVATAALTEFEG